MKHLAIILAAFMFALNFADACNYQDEFAGTAGIQNSHHDEKQELCSPLCNCARCTFSVTVPQQLTISTVIQSRAERPGAVSEGSPRHVIIPVWQPPKA